MNSGLSWRYILTASLLILIPCFWQSRIQSADLASHIYNAWLASLVERGELPGLYITTQWTNVLFDLMLLRFLTWFGPEWAQRIAVSISVLVFFWGSLAAIRAIGKRSPLHIVLILAVFTYGFVFRMGLFNFYLGMGFSFGALAFLWHRPSLRWLWALPLGALALLSHLLPVVWLIGVILYTWAARALRPRRRILLLATTGLTILALAAFIFFELPSEWLSRQPLLTSGADQLVLNRNYYPFLMVGTIIFQTSLLVSLIDRLGIWRLTFSIPFQLVLLQAMALAFIPSAIQFPGVEGAFSLFVERMGLAQGVVALGLLSLAPAHRLHRPAAMGLLTMFFALSYVDSRRLNAIEDSVEMTLQQIPSGAHVLSGLCNAGRINGAFHLVDRACIGNCFSYGNYEASSGHFRLRTRPGKGVVMSDYVSANQAEYGGYTAKPEDLPLYLIENRSGTVRWSEVRAGQTIRRACP